MSFLYGDVAPRLMTDEQIDYTLREIDEDLAACAKLKPGPWSTEISGLYSRAWQDDPRNMCVRILAPHVPGKVGVLHQLGGYDIAGGTIHDTQREVFFMAAMREEYPAMLRRWRDALVALRQMRKVRAVTARRKGRRG